MIIEIMYSGFLLFGDRGNVEYLEKTFPEAQFVYTEITDEPRFVSTPVDLIYMGPMSEGNLVAVTTKLLPHKDRIRQLIEAGTFFLVVATALEIFGHTIELTDGRHLQTLDLFPFTTKRNMKDRHDSAVLGSFQDLKIMGYDARFTEQYGNEDIPFLKVERGHGFNRKSTLEGIHYQNFFGTNLLGPILVMNPPLIKYIKQALTGDDAIPYEEYMKAGYEVRLDKFLTSKEILDQAKYSKVR
ncbi:MAG: hypothetical protein WAV55_08655 [Clostridiaceae bacterium]